MKEKFRTLAASAVLALLLILSAYFTGQDHKADVYPNQDTRVCLYGEAHGSKEYYDIELKLWQGYYREGCRSLFVELPYYSGEFLNLWMQEDSDAILDAFFEDIEGTLSGNAYYREFLLNLKETCPETVFYGTDVGHQYETTGNRYLTYLQAHNLADTETYRLAETCIEQGKKFAAENSEYGMSALRERYMIDNFIKAFERCGEQKVMGIYGSWHTDLYQPDRMAYALQKHYQSVAGVRLSSLALRKNPYEFGFCISGIVFLLMLMIPNMVWAKSAKPQGYEEAARENRILLGMERIGEVSVSAMLAVFTSLNPCIRKLPEGLMVDMRICFWLLAFVLMIFYEGYWVRYFRSRRTMADFYSSFLGFPVAGATLPVLAVLILSLYAGNVLLLGAAVVLGIGHIGIHLMHQREAAG